VNRLKESNLIYLNRNYRGKNSSSTSILVYFVRNPATMLSLMKKALQLEKEDENDLVESAGCLRSQSQDMESGRSVSPISQFRNPFGEDDEDTSDHYDEYDCNFPNSDDARFSIGISPDKRDEDDEEHHPLSFFFQPVEELGNWETEIEKEIQAARRAASISVTSDNTQGDEQSSLFSVSNERKIKLLKDALKDPTTKLKLKPSHETRQSPAASRTPGTKDLKSILFQHQQYVIEYDDLGEGVSVQTSLPPYNELEVKLCSNSSQAALASQNNASTSAIEYYKGSIEDPTELDSPPSRRRVENDTHKVPPIIDGVASSNDLPNCLSATESDVDSLDGLPSNLQSKWLMGESRKEQMLASLDGVQSITKQQQKHETDPLLSFSSNTNYARESLSNDVDTVRKDIDDSLFEVWPFNLFCGKMDGGADESDIKQGFVCKENADVPLALLDCANIIYQEDRMPVTAPAVPTSLIRVASDQLPLPYAETLLAAEVDPRMQDWIGSQFKLPGKPPKDGTYHLGKSRTVIVHEIARGAWTWCTTWSPDGSVLAVATENHHLALIDTTSSSVWRVRHDRRISGPMKNHTTHSIRAIAWGKNYIAIGGTGNAVSILSPIEPYLILHTITGTGFVGALDWREKSNILAIGSRLDKVTIVRISSADEESVLRGSKQTDSHVVNTINLKYWANSVKFCSGGMFLAVGDSGGVISVYKFSKLTNGQYETNMIAWFPRRDSILALEWSPDGKWLYAGGEDRCVTVIDCCFWEIVHKKGRERWIQCIASSNGGSHLAVGGVSSEISLLDANNGWESVLGIELKGLVPLSASWHPNDQYLALTGQNNSILVVETTNARHVKGHHLYSISPVLAIEFSPDGRMAIIGNQAGVVTFFALSGTSFITAYELVVTLNKSICARWSLNGTYAVLGAKDAVIVIGRKKGKRQGKKIPPNLSGFSVKKVIREYGETNAVSIDFRSQYVAISGNSTRILDARADFALVGELSNGPIYANAWSPDGRWFAMIGSTKLLTIYDTSDERVDRWRPIFSMKCDFVWHALRRASLFGIWGLKQ
jgi:WD40 repeat protein